MDEYEERKQPYTIEDVAKALGISKTTVSRAISGKGRISVETRTRVLKFIQEHNYSPNAVAQSLAQSRTYNLSIAIPGDYTSSESAFFQECMRGICQVASENEYDVLVSIIPNHNTDQLERVLRNHKIDGAIVTRSSVKSPVIALLKQWKLPFVVLGELPDRDVVCVDNNNEEACADLTRRLLKQGLRKLALIGGDEAHYVSHCRKRGFEAAHDLEGCLVHPELVFRNIDTTKKASVAVNTALRRGADCIICMDDYICSLVMQQLKNCGVRVPEDIKLASFYDSVLLGQSTPAVTSLHFDAENLGKAGCHLLLDQLEGTPGVRIARMGYQIMIRESTGT